MIMNPTAIKHVVVDGHSLTLESFVAIARYNATVELAPSALEAMQKSRALAEKIAAEGRVAYGITTGFGEFQKVAVPKEMSHQPDPQPLHRRRRALCRRDRARHDAPARQRPVRRRERRAPPPR